MAHPLPFRRPGQEPPAPPPPEAPAPTGNVCPTLSERAGMSEVAHAAQQIARLNSGPSTPAALFSGLPKHIAAMRAALDRLEQAHQHSNGSRV